MLTGVDAFGGSAPSFSAAANAAAADSAAVEPALASAGTVTAMTFEYPEPPSPSSTFRFFRWQVPSSS